MNELVNESGRFRSGDVGVFSNGRLIHMAPPAGLVREQIRELLDWVRDDRTHILIKSCVFHYEFEFIHPFNDGNGRMGRMWQTLILSHWKTLFAWLPFETLIREKQSEYYAALGESDRTATSDSTILFLLNAIKQALTEIHEGKHEELPDVSDKVRKAITALGNDTLSAAELMKRLGLNSRASLRKNYLDSAIQIGFVVMTEPDKPNSRNQKYKRS